MLIRLSLIFFLIVGSFVSREGIANDKFPEVEVVTSYYEPYSFQDDQGVQGFAVQQARKVFAELDFFPSIKIYPWARAYNIALKQPSMLIFSMARTPEREDKFHWIGEIVDFNVFLFKAKGRENLNINNLDDLKGYKIGALHKDVKGEYLLKKGVKITTLNNEEIGIKMVLNRRIDLLPTDIVSMKHRLKKNGLPDDALEPVFHLKEISKPLYMAFSKDTPIEIVEAFRSAYKRAFP